MTHEACVDRLSDYLDGELPAHEHGEVAAHLAACGECRDVLAELQAVAFRAAALRDDDTAPAADLWPGVTKRIRLDRARRAHRTFSFTLPQLVAAGLALMVLSGGLVWLARLGGERTDFPAVTAGNERAATQPPAIMPANFAELQYERAIADLHETLDAERARLDPHTVRVLEASLAAIDRAIEQSSLALAEDPANAYLNSHLAAARKRKLDLLRRATALADLGS
jgi:hypothetical protein